MSSFVITFGIAFKLPHYKKMMQGTFFNGTVYLMMMYIIFNRTQLQQDKCIMYLSNPGEHDDFKMCADLYGRISSNYYDHPQEFQSWITSCNLVSWSVRNWLKILVASIYVESCLAICSYICMGREHTDQDTDAIVLIPKQLLFSNLLTVSLRYDELFWGWENQLRRGDKLEVKW